MKVTTKYLNYQDLTANTALQQINNVKQYSTVRQHWHTVCTFHPHQQPINKGRQMQFLNVRPCNKLGQHVRCRIKRLVDSVQMNLRKEPEWQDTTVNKPVTHLIYGQYHLRA